MKRYFLSLIILLLVCFQGYGQLEFSVELRLKPQVTTARYMATESAGIKALTSMHGVTLTQTMPGARNPELLLYYTLTIEGSCMMSRQSRADILNRESIINDFLATGLFENHVREFEIAYTNLCPNPISANDPNFQNAHGWALRMINAPCAWSITTGNPNILIGIADTEFRATHEDFQGQLALVLGQSSSGDHHGTSVASVAGARTNNGRGIAGIGFNSRIAAHRIPHTITFDDEGRRRVSASSVNIFNAIWNLYRAGVPIINVSWTTTGLSRAQAQEITQNGTVLVISAGNYVASQQHANIADIPGVIIVSSVNSNNMNAPTNHARNRWVDVVAPGTGLWVAGGDGDNHYRTAGGTSFSAPFVAGIIALMLSVNPDLTPAQIENIIKATTDPVADGHLFPGLLGAGRVNAYSAVRAALATICVYTFANEIVIENETVWGCDNLEVENVRVTNNARLTIEAPGTVRFGPGFRVEAGSSLMVKPE